MRAPLHGRIQKLRQDQAQLLKLHRLGDVRVKARLDALGVYVTEDVSRERDDGEVRVFFFALPAADLLAGFVAVFVGHVEVALPFSLGLGLQEENDRNGLQE